MYYDHNATSPMPPSVQRAVSDAMADCWANPSSPHRMGQSAAMAVQRSRTAIAARLGVLPKHVFFTSGATEANAWLLSNATAPVLASSTEHPSVLAWATEQIPVDRRGLVDLDWLSGRLADGPALVSVMAANNETGVIQPISDIHTICQRFDAPLHCDATQWLGRMNEPVSADWITISAHKFGGPRGVGALVGRAPDSSLLRGGSQERGHRAGTLNVPGIVGFGAAVATAGSTSSLERDRLEAFCIARGGTVVGSGVPRLSNTLCVLFDYLGDTLVAALDLEGVFASTGSACSSGSAQESHVLRAMGIAGVPVRFSFGPDTSATPAMEALDRVLTRMGESCA
jgi:cysteine desulfurase